MKNKITTILVTTRKIYNNNINNTIRNTEMVRVFAPTQNIIYKELTFVD